MKRMLDKVLENKEQCRNRGSVIAFDIAGIEFEVTSGDKHQGSFRITTDDSYKPEGYVYSSDLRMIIKTPEFGGLNKEIIYIYDSTGLKEGAEEKGTLHIVSNLGECDIPYTVRVTNNILISCLGEVRNLFHYANLAMANWQEAVDLFYSPAFETILVGNDAQYLEYYRGLSNKEPDENGNLTIGNEGNVERFLEVIKKKKRVNFSISSNRIEIKDPSEDIVKEIKVIKDRWGFSYLKVDIDGDFLSTDKEELTDDDFIENECSLKVYINFDGLYRGINHGKIILSNFYQTLEISFKVSLAACTQKETFTKRRDTAKLMKYYIDYRMGTINKIEWAKNSSVVISKMLLENPEDIETKLYQAHLLNVQKRESESLEILQITNTMIDKDTEVHLQGYSLYLQYILTKDEEDKQKLSNAIELLYVQNKSNYRLAWFLLYMKEEYIKDDYERYKMLRFLYEQGCVSPLIYIEALNVMVSTATVMTRIDDFELAIIRFAMKYDALTSDVRNRFVYLASKEVRYSEEIFNILTYCYYLEPKDEVLMQICSMLMKGNRIGNECFIWYEKAIENEIRLNRLYEYYMMSIDMDYKDKLPKIILMYFAYRSNLDYERNAFLYANVLRHQPAYHEIYEDYIPVIEEFAKEQLALHRINDNLAYIYKTVLGDKLYEAPFVQDYASVLLTHKITVTNEQITAVIVVDAHLTYERSYPIYNCQADIPLIDGEKCIILEDAYKNRYADSSMYSVKRIIDSEPKMDKVMLGAGLSLLPALYLAEKSVEQATISENNEEALLFLSDCNEISEEYRLRIMMELAEYYFDTDDIAKLDELLLRFDPAVLTPEMREKSIRILVARGMYDRALDWVETYGTEYIDDRVLVRLCDRVLVRCDYEYDPEILKICESIFRKGRYDETVLTYLIMYKQGASKSLKSLWRASDSFNLDVHGLLENMIVQLLYSGAVIGEEGNVLLEYISGGTNQELEMMFLDMLAYRYFVKQEKIEEKVFDRCVYLHQTDEKISDYIKLAFLQRCHSLNIAKKLDSEQKALVVLFLKDFTLRHIMFPFFMDFKNLWSKLSIYEDRCFIEYRGSEESKVYLHYVIEHGQNRNEEYRRQEMTHLIGGIYVQSFILFYGERIKYYITEEDSRTQKLTKASLLELPECDLDDSERRFSAINNLAISHELKDDETYYKLAEEYAKKVYMVNNLFVGK